MTATTYTATNRGLVGVGSHHLDSLPMTKLAPGKGSVRVSADGRFTYAREGSAWTARDEQTGQFVWDEKFDSMHLGFTSLADARRHTATIA